MRCGILQILVEITSKKTFWILVIVTGIAVANFLSLQYNLRFATNKRVSEKELGRNGDSDDGRKAARQAERDKYKRKIGYFRLHGVDNDDEFVRILYRYAYWVGANVILPNDTDVQSIGYPGFFDTQLIQGYPGSSSEFDMIALHSRWNRGEYTKLLGKEANFITMMQNPVESFISLYDTTLHELERFYGAPLSALAQDIRFGKTPKIERLAGIYGRNQIAWNFGLQETDFDDEEKIGQLIRNIEDQFSVILISEYYNESLIAFKEKLKLPIQFIRNNEGAKASGAKKKLSVSLEDRKALEKWMGADMRIYEYFRRKFEIQLQENGRENTENEIKKLEQMNKQTWDRCYDPSNKNVELSGESITEDETEWAVPFRMETSYCRVHGLTEASLHQDLLYIQKNRDFRHLFKDPVAFYRSINLDDL